MLSQVHNFTYMEVPYYKPWPIIFQVVCFVQIGVIVYMGMNHGKNMWL